MKTMLQKMIQRLTVDKQSPGYHMASGVKCDFTEQNFPNTKRRMGRVKEEKKRSLYIYRVFGKTLKT